MNKPLFGQNKIHIFSSLRRAVLLAIAFAVSDTCPLFAQDAPKEGRTQILPQISIIDKLLCAEQTLGPSLGRLTRDAWDIEYKSLYTKFKEDANPKSLEDRGRPIMALALGVKASDGVIALQARDKEALNDCADSIEKLARKLGVPATSLQRASLVKQHALQGHWIEAFMHLGYLQQAVMSDLEKNPERKDEAFLIIMGGWLQGGRSVTSLVLKVYSKPGSNILREPKLIDLMISEMAKVRKEYKENPVVKELIAFLPEVKRCVNVGLKDPIPEKDVQFMHDGFERIVKLIIRGEQAAPAATPPADVPTTKETQPQSSKN